MPSRRAIDHKWLMSLSRRVDSAQGGGSLADATENDPTQLWGRLSRRKVVKWGIAYVAGAWALLQGIALAWYRGDRGQQRVTDLELTTAKPAAFPFGMGSVGRGACRPILSAAWSAYAMAR